MATNRMSVEFRDYVRVVFARGWWFLLITLAMVGAVFYYSFYKAPKVYEARNEIVVMDKYSGALPKNMVSGLDWLTRLRKAELDFKRTVPATEVLSEAAGAVGVTFAEDRMTRLAQDFGDDMKLEYSKDGGFVKFSYMADNADFAAAVLSSFIKRLISSSVIAQVQELNTKVETLSSQRARLDGEVAAARRKLDDMKTLDPEMRLAATTMAIQGDRSRTIGTAPSMEQAVGVFLDLEKEVISLDGRIAEAAQQISLLRQQIAREPQTVPSAQTSEVPPAVRETMARRDALRLQLTGLLSNSTAAHPMVKEIQAELASLDAFLQSATMQPAVRVVFQENTRRKELLAKAEELENGLGGMRQKRETLEANAQAWRKKLDTMPAALRVFADATMEYQKKSERLSSLTIDLVNAQIERSLQLEQVGTYYRPQYELTPVPSVYRNRHLIHLLMGVVLGLAASVFVVYAIEFADHSVKDQKDLRCATNAVILGVVSDYNQMRAVASMPAMARALTIKQYIPAAIFVCGVAALGWGMWHNWPKARVKRELPASLSIATVSNIEEAMKMYTTPDADLSPYEGAVLPQVNLTPAVEVPDQGDPGPSLSQ